jgi:hypothetical protein
MSRTTRLALAVCALLLLAAPSALASGARGHDDAVRGTVHNDRLHDDRGSDRFYGGRGDDRIDARDRHGRHDRRDVVDCGAGDDTAYADRDDVVRRCEHVVRDDQGVHAPGTDDHGVHAPGTDDHGDHAPGTDDQSGRGGSGGGGGDDAPGHQ